MRKIKFILVTLALMISLVILTSCGDNMYLATVDGNIYSKLDQTITLSFTEDGEFKDSINKNDFVLSEGLDGKSVSDVKFINTKKVEVTIGGEASKLGEGDYAFHPIEIKSNIKGGKANFVVRMFNYEPEAEVISFAYTASAAKVYCSSTLELPYGKYIIDKCYVGNITLPNDNGTLTVEANHDSLTLVVKNYVPEENAKYPVVKIPAECTTFNKDLYVYIGKSGRYILA